MPKTFHYLTCCIDSTGAAINAMVEQARDVTYETVLQHCDLREFADSLGYVTNPQHGGLSLKQDWHVSYHKSIYQGERCYYVRHSAIEYIFTERATHV